MAAMTLDPSSRGQVTIPSNVYPMLCDASPGEHIVGSPGRSVIKCANVAFGATFQIAGVDAAGATWVSPSTIFLTWTPATYVPQEGQVINPDGKVSNKIRLQGI